MGVAEIGQGGVNKNQLHKDSSLAGFTEFRNETQGNTGSE
jgi:hypothetical protein